MNLSKFLYRIIKRQRKEIKHLDKKNVELIAANFRQAQRIGQLERELRAAQTTIPTEAAGGDIMDTVFTVCMAFSVKEMHNLRWLANHFGPIPEDAAIHLLIADAFVAYNPDAPKCRKCGHAQAYHYRLENGSLDACAHGDCLGFVP